MTTAQLHLPLKPTGAQLAELPLRWLGYVLHVVNCDPPLIRRKEFYALKVKLLSRFGTADGFDIQHIKKTCHGCKGTGIYDHYRYGEVSCNRCKDGIYQESWIKLERWYLGGYRFHNPVDRIEQYDTRNPYKGLETIEGRIEHERATPGHIADEVWYWLMIFFDRDTFKASFGHCGHIGRHWSRWLPLCALATLTMDWRSHCEKVLGWHGEWSSFRRTQGQYSQTIDSHVEWLRANRDKGLVRQYNGGEAWEYEPEEEYW